MENMQDKLREVKKSLGDLAKEHPDFIKAFHNFMEVSEKEGALPRKTKEIISVALSIAEKCEWCIAFHVKAALDAGATKEELLETCFVAALMGGGPSLMYAQLVLKAINDFSA